MYILGGDMAQVHTVYACAVVDVMCHAGRGHDIVNRHIGVRVEYGFRVRAPRMSAPCVYLAHLAYHLKQSRASPRAVSLQGRRDRQAYSLGCPRLVCHDKARVKRVEATLDTLDRRIERLQVYRYVLPLGCHYGWGYFRRSLSMMATAK